jgi:suppressor for copper-sensitivity B
MHGFGKNVFLGILAVGLAWMLPAMSILAQPPVPSAQTPGGPVIDFGSPLGFGQDTGSELSVEAQFTVSADGEPARLFVTATIKPGWHIYSITQAPGGPVRTTISVTPSDAYRVVGDFQAATKPERDREAEKLFGGLIVETQHGTVTWHAPIELAANVDPASLMITGKVKAQLCDANSCLPTEDFPFEAGLGTGIELTSQQQPLQVAQDGASDASVGTVDWGALGVMLVGAFFGGLILNLMPCVLPVISLKLLSFVEQAGQGRAQVFVLNLWYSAGLLIVFLVLAALSASFSLAWGEQFTLPWFKVTLTALVFVMALSFLGVWEIPIPGFVGSGRAGKLQVQEGAAGAFAKGVFTTILATPCTGPFLGPVFGFTLEQPAYVAYLLFGTVGLGMASPYLIIGAFPQLIRFLPKPGAWMETVKEVMAFLLLGTVVYLFTTMNERYFVPTLALLVGLWFACWLIGRTSPVATGQTKLRVWIGGLGTAAIIGYMAFSLLLHEPELAWQPFSPQTVREAHSEGRTVMVDFSADWCPNCKWNLAWAIDTARVAKLVDANGVVPVLADWTDQSPTIKDFLAQRLKRQSIPVLAIWPATAPYDQPIILDGTLTESQVLKALERAGPSMQPGSVARFGSR